MTAARTNHIAVTLQGGPMFIAGGFGTGGSTALATAEIIDSEVSYTPVSAQMITPRANAAAILLRDGRVLIAGGGNNGNGDNTAELFDPTTNTFYPTANNMAQSRGRFAVPLLLNSGRVLIVGGTSSSGQVDIFDPTTDSFIANPPSLKQPRNMMAAALLPNGKVLVAGGAGTIVNPGCGDPGPTGSLQSAELYDPVANSFSCAGMMLLPVQEFSALTLPNGTVLLPSGRNESAAPADLTTATSELYNPQTQQFSSTAPLRDGRYLYDSFLLNGAGNATPLGEQNDALVAGGTAQDGGTSLLSAELYNAPDQLVSGTATVTSISVFPASATVPVGRSYQFTGVATLSDLSTRFVPVPATWASSNTGLATAATNGVITPLAGSAGQSVNVTVNFGSVTSPPAVLHISGSALSFSPPGTQSANQGVPFSEDLSTYTSGGTPPYTYSIVSGSTSPFTLSGSVISGTASSTGSATFTVRVFDSAANTLTAAQTINITNPLSITNIIPSTAAAGFGQMVTIFTTGVPNPSQATATFTNGGSPQGGFVFLGASSPNELWVRIPSGFPTGATNVVVTNTSTSDSSAPFPITVSTTPGTPQTYAVYGESAAPGGSGGACGSGPTGSPINSVVAGQGIVVYGYGIDTAGSNVVFYDGSHAALTVTPACSFSSATGIGLVVTVPFGYLNNGPIQIGLQTQVNGTSPLSAIGYYPSTFTLTSWQVNINSIPDTPTTAGQGFPISAQLLDNNNNPVSGVAVTASVSSNFCPSGALEGTVTMQTDTNGNVSYTDTNITLGGNDYVLTVAPPFAPSAGDQDSLVTNVGFCPTLNNMSDSRDLHTSVLVSSGSPPQASDSGPILVAGGIDNSGVVSNTADLYNAATNKFTASSHTMVSARAGHTATALGNNKVLLAGGYADASSGLGTNTGTAEIYNATTDTFTATTGEMVHPRQGHTATLLSNGMVLIAGGIADTDGYNGSINIPAELYDPSTGLFTAIGNPMVNVRTGHTATLLPDGTVLIAGGAVPIPAGGGGYTLSYTNTAEIFTLNTGTPANSTFTATTNNMSSARYGQIAVFTPPINSGLLSPPFPNQVLLAGGTASNLNTDDQTSADLYDPTSKTFTPTGSMATARWGHVGVAQFNGSVMVAGGDSVNVTQLSSAELFKPTFGSNPPTGTFQPQPSMSVPRINATATGNFSNLSNPDNPFTGIILVTGGFGNGVTQNTGEVYYGGSGLATF